MGTIISRFTEKSTEKSTDKTTCISVTAETYKCIDISAFVPTCITITSNVPTSELYQEQYDKDDIEITDAPILEIILINNEAPILNVNLDEEGTIYVTDFDTVYIDITNWNTNAEYVNIFSNQDGNDAVVFLDEAEQRIVWALDDYALDGTQMWLNAQAKESDKLISPQSSVTVMQMEQTNQPVLSSWVSQDGNTVLDIKILNYDETHIYNEPEVTGGTAVRTDNIIAWTLPIGDTSYHEISITATAPLMYESLAGVSGGVVTEPAIPKYFHLVAFDSFDGVGYSFDRGYYSISSNISLKITKIIGDGSSIPESLSITLLSELPVGTTIVGNADPYIIRVVQGDGETIINTYKPPGVTYT